MTKFISVKATTFLTLSIYKVKGKLVTWLQKSKANLGLS